MSDLGQAQEISVNDKRLWCAVILQALEDAVASPSPMLRAHEIEQARNWFKRAGPDFREACNLAGLEPDQVQKKALAAIARHDSGKPLCPVDKPSPKTQTDTYVYQGERHTLDQLAKLSGLKRAVIRYRLEAGWPVDRAVTTPKLRSGANSQFGTFTRRAKTYPYQGRRITITEMAVHCGVSNPAIHQRLKAGWSIDRIMRTPAI